MTVPRQIAPAVLSLLLLAATPSQLPGETTQHRSPPAKHNKAHGKNQNTVTPTPTPTPTAPAQFTAAENQEATYQVAPSNEKKSEPIRVAPVDVNGNRLNVSRDWTDYTFVAFSFLLVIVGGFQVWLLAGSLQATEKAADAAEMALIGNRPYLLITCAIFRGWEVIDAHPNQMVHGENTWWHVQFDVQNCGTAPAIITDIITHLDAVPVVNASQAVLPKPQDYSLCISTEDLHLPDVLPATHPWHFKTAKTDGSDIRSKRNRIDHGELQVIAYGRIKYRDFLEREYESGFLWMFHPEGLQRGDITRWEVRYMHPGPKEYQYTQRQND